MPSAGDTAYPRLKANPSEKMLFDIYTPNDHELDFAQRRTREPVQRVGLLLLMKTFQSLGYFVRYSEIPSQIVRHISACVGYPDVPEDLPVYDDSTARKRHQDIIRDFLSVTACGPVARQIITETCLRASRSRDDLPDIINMAIEELIRQRYELPAFSTLLRIARASRSRINQGYQNQIFSQMEEKTRQRLHKILACPEGSSRSLWDQIKQEPKRSTVPHLRELLDHLHWLQAQNEVGNFFANIPEAKLAQFAAEARSLDVSSLNDMPEQKRLTLVVAFIYKQVAQALDDVANMFIRQVKKMHNKAEEALKLYKQKQEIQTDELIERLHSIVLAYKAESSREERMANIERLLERDADSIIAQCTTRSAISGNNYLPFLSPFYNSRRNALFQFLEKVPLVSTTQDHALIDAITFMLRHKKTRREWLEIAINQPDKNTNTPRKYLDLSFVTDKWWVLVTGQRDKTTTVEKVNRRCFELCVLSAVMQELKSGDLCILGSDQYSDYRAELVSIEEYEQGIDLYGEQAGIPVKGPQFVEQLKTILEATATKVDSGFPDNEYLNIVNGEPILKRLKRKSIHPGFYQLDQLLTNKMTEVDIIDILSDTEHWLNWTRFFSPISGHDAKLSNPRERYLITTFCYGCNLGPTQTARSITNLDRRQVSFVNQRHVTEDKLNQAINIVINAYNQLPLQRLWGSGNRASADGTKWDVHPNTLISEYHIRHGGYGGVGYYMVSDSYVAIMSRFQTCGAWEGHYILDFIEENKSEVRPDTIHADTQGQSTAIFGLAYLLGIQLMPRIRNWKDLNLCRPSYNSSYTHIDSLFSTQADWNLIETMLPDMLRVALSIKAGTIMPSTILRRLATYSRKNKLYFAFRELGRVVRTIFLLNYISDIDLRHIIQSSTNKSEAFNKFVQWICFGGEGVISENVRDEQRKVIKYNHLVANLVAFHTVVSMTKAMNQLIREGYSVDIAAASLFSPYRIGHINRFGSYVVNFERIPDPLESTLINFDIER